MATQVYRVSRVLTAAGSPVARIQARNEEGHELGLELPALRRPLSLIPIQLEPRLLLLGRRQRQNLRVGDGDAAFPHLALDGVGQIRQSESLFHEPLGHAEAGGDSGDALAPLHQLGKRLVLVKRLHRQPFEVLGE